MTSTLPSIVSQDGRLAAVVSPTSSSSRLRIQIYQVSAATSSCSLQQTLTYQKSPSDAASSTKVLKLLFPSSSSNFLIAFLAGGEEIVIWDLTRGVVADTITPSSLRTKNKDDTYVSDEKFLDVTTSALVGTGSGSGEAEFYVLTASTTNNKLHTLECRGSRVIRKIKSGKHEKDDIDPDDGSFRLAVSADHVLVQDLGYIRVMDRKSFSKVGRIKLKHSPPAGSSLLLSICPTHPNIAMTMHDAGSGGSTSNGILGLYDISSCKPITEQFLPTSSSLDTASISGTAVAQLLGTDGNSNSTPSTVTLLVNQILYTVKKSSQIEELSRVLTTGSSHSVGPHAMHFLIPSKKVLILQYPMSRRGGDNGNSNYGGECTCRMYSLDDGPNSVPDRIDLSQPQHEMDESKSNGLKRGAAQSSTLVLGPGQAGSESRNASVAAPPAKKAKVGTSDDSNEDLDDAESNEGTRDETTGLTIAERLEQLTETMDDGGMYDLDDEDEESDNEDEDGETKKAKKKKGDQANDVVTPTVTKFVPKKATTESLVELLTQALKSNDDTLLELALSVRDTKVIKRTLQELQPPSLLTALLGKLTTRLASSPMRAQALVIWLSPCLKQGHILQNDGTVLPRNHINALRNLLHERMESFQDLLRLEGRLSMMCE